MHSSRMREVGKHWKGEIGQPRNMPVFSFNIAILLMAIRKGKSMRETIGVKKLDKYFRQLFFGIVSSKCFNLMPCL